jgi:hypothetical protein
MNHDFESKAWADNHHVLSDGIAHLFSSIASAIIRLKAYAFTTSSTDDNNPSSESASIGNQTSVQNDVE